jgi:hypothetical protein
MQFASWWDNVSTVTARRKLNALCLTAMRLRTRSHVWRDNGSSCYLAFAVV